MTLEEEYIQLLNLYARVVDSVQGEKVSADWLVDVEPLSAKLFQHLGTLCYLAEGTKLPDVLGKPFQYIDYPSIAALARVICENYLTFFFVFVDPSVSIEEKYFRYQLWKLSGLISRQKFRDFVSPQNKQKIVLEAKIIDELHKQILASPFYNQLPSGVQKQAKKGDWRMNKSWEQLAKIAGFDREYFQVVYRLLSSYSHTDYLCVLKIGQPDSEEKRTALNPKTWLQLGLMIMGRFVFDYASVFPKTQEILISFSDEASLANIWRLVACKE